MLKLHSPVRAAMGLFAALVITVCTFAGAYQFEKWRVMHLGKAELRVQADSMNNLLQQYAVTPRLLVSDPRLLNLLLHSEEAEELSRREANTVLENAAAAGNLAEVFLMNSTGVTVAASNSQTEFSFVGKNYGFRPYFQGAIQGHQTKFFGVGATTGIPGYFIANPLYDGAVVIGVVVAKVGPGQIPTLWREKPGAVVLTDELGVVLLASPIELLYTPTKELSRASLDVVADERRYSLHETDRFNRTTIDRWSHYRGDEFVKSYIVISESLRTEPWQLSAMLPVSSVLWRALQYLLTLLAAGLIVALAISRHRQQKQLMLINDRYAKDLEQLVQEKTLELEATRDALIAESNFAVLGRMSAAINHEINQPLASLRFNLASLRQIIERKSHADREVREIVIDSDRTTKRIGRVVETLRSVARYDRLPSSLVYLEQVIQEVSDTVKRERPQMSQCLEVGITTTSTPVYGNAVLLQQAILNLLYNSFDAVLKVQRPSVTLRLHHNTEIVKIEVADNGVGVSDDMKERLFEPFEGSLQKTSGMGLGLTLAKQIINDHSGSISYRTLESKACVNTTGSVFIISLPWYDPQSVHSDDPKDQSLR